MTIADEQPRLGRLGHLAFGIVVAIVLARCLMLVAIRDAGTAGADAPAGPGATVSLTLDLLSLVPVLLLLLRRLVDDRFTLRFTLVHAFAAALGAWTLSSVGWADDRFAALVGATNVCAAVALFWTSTQLVRRWDQFRVVAGLAVGVLLANVAQGVIYQTVEFPALKESWAQTRLQHFADNGWKPDDYVAKRFEQKLMAGEFLGFNASPNTMGAICVLGALVALGAAAQRLADRDDPGWTGLLAIAALAALYPLGHSGSKASWGALALGVALIALWRVARGWLASHRPLVFATGCVGVALAIAGVVALGLTRGGLPNDSLNFRWRYWAGSAPIFGEHPILGVGWANFGSHYLAHRLPPAAEEIVDPHNLLVRWATELGSVGVGLGVAWLGLWAWRAGRPARRAALAPTVGDRPVSWLLIAAAGALALSAACAIEFGVGSGDGLNYAVIELLKRTCLFAAIALALAATSLATSKDGSAGGDRAPTLIDARPAPWLAAAATVAVAMLLLQSMIDLAFFEPGLLALACTLMGARLGLAVDDRPRRTDAKALVALVACGIVVLVMLAAVVVPVGLAESSARRAERLAQRQPARAIEFYQDADEWSPVPNVSYVDRAARIAVATGDPSAGALIDRAIAADPNRAVSHLNRGRWLLPRATTPETAAAVVASYERAMALNPNEVDTRIEYADVLARLGRPREASAQLFRALADDEALDPAEPERLDLRSPGARAELQRRAARLQQAAGG